MQHINGFVKISEIVKDKINIKVNDTPNLKEIQLFSLTNKLIDHQILNSFVYSFNKLLLNKNYANFEGKKYSILITEDISDDFKDLTSYLRSHKHLPECVILELVYTLHVLNIIKLKHMDLHGGNIFIKTLPKSEQKLVKYDVIIKQKMYSFYVPTTHIIKIIDLDSGHKSSNINKEIKNEFGNSINNPHKFTGRVKTNNKSNILKLVHTIIRSNPTLNIATQLFHMGLRSSSSKNAIPFYPSANSIEMNKLKYNSKYLKNYGILLKTKKNKYNFLNIPDKVVWSPEKMLLEMIKIGLFQKPEDHHIFYSQVNLYK